MSFDARAVQMSATSPARFDTVLARLASVGCRPRQERRCWKARCPAHHDSNPSLSVGVGRDGTVLLKCFAGCGLAQIVAALGLEVGDLFERDADHRSHRKPTPEGSCFGPADAQRTWQLAYERARDDDAVTKDAETYTFLARRGLLVVVEDCEALGILGPDMEPSLPAVVRHWPGLGYRVVAPLYSTATGALLAVQARRIFDREPKTLTPRGCRITGTAFMNVAACELVACRRPANVVVVCEGLTDHLALTMATGLPVLSIPGASTAASVMGPFVHDITVLIATDDDRPGETAAHRIATSARRYGAARTPRLRWPSGCKDACDALGQLGPRRLGERVEAAV